MLAPSTESQPPPLDSSRSVLDFVHSLLITPAEEQADLDRLLDELAVAFAISSAGMATFPDGKLISIGSKSAAAQSDSSLPWQQQPELIERLPRARGVLTLPHSAGGSFLLTMVGTPENRGWFLWLLDEKRDKWSNGEAALLVLTGQALMHVLMQNETLTSWAIQLDRRMRRQRMEEAAAIVRRLAHDFGNVLTGILGFSELALAQQIAANSPLHAYLEEVHRGAQNAAHYTNQLRLFARRQGANNRSCNLGSILIEEEKRLRPSLGAAIQLKLYLPTDLPDAAVEAEPLRQALGIVLENAREAIPGEGVIEVSARVVQISLSETRNLFGDVRPGKHLEILVSDNGSGLSPEAQRQLFTEPFFSTKSRKRGFGLAMAYGILSSHRGGLELQSRPEGGTIARLIVPVAEVAARTSPRLKEGGLVNDRVLIVDDDPMVLQFTATTLEQAGFRIQTAGNAQEAIKKYKAAAADPFRLVLSDVLMPEMNGIELARHLLTQDASLSILFMSGEIHADIMQQCLGSARIELLPKPFRPDGLVRAVRNAIDRARW
jgi:signal transduction histidine kinase